MYQSPQTKKEQHKSLPTKPKIEQKNMTWELTHKRQVQTQRHHDTSSNYLFATMILFISTSKLQSLTIKHIAQCTAFPPICGTDTLLTSFEILAIFLVNTFPFANDNCWSNWMYLSLLLFFFCQKALALAAPSGDVENHTLTVFRSVRTWRGNRPLGRQSWASWNVREVIIHQPPSSSSPLSSQSQLP